MTETSFDVRFWKTEVYEGKKSSSYYVRWTVAGKQWREPFKDSRLAESFRSTLVASARKGEAFDVSTGRPLSMLRAANDMPFLALAMRFADMKWNDVAGTTRRTHAEALAKLTVAMISTDTGRPDERLVRHTLNRWAFNPNKRTASSCPREVWAILRWLERHSRPTSDLMKKDILRSVLDSLKLKLDGKPGAPSVVNRHKRIFNTLIEYAVELKILALNPIKDLKWVAPRANLAVDKRAVANPVQVRTLLNAVREGRNGDRLVAFFGCLYYAALRPEEAVSLKKHNLRDVPAEGWGEIHLDAAEPFAGREWTDSGENRDRRGLKQRAIGEGRTVPCPPELTALLNEHIGRFGFAHDGRIFVGARNRNELPKGTINRAWREARETAFTPEVADSPLAATPYDLRHAMISFWIMLGISVADIARWAGHSIDILFAIYAAWLSNKIKLWQNKIDEGFGQ